VSAETDANKALVVEFIRRFETGDLDHAFELLADEFRWEVMGDSPIAGVHDKPTIRAIAQGVVDVFPTPPRWTPTNVIAEADQVAVEAVSSGDAVSGFAYRNRYHLLATVRDGAMVEVKEYMDTKHVADLMASMAAYTAASASNAAASG
jgi:hypothetical protein